jgi:hypothetical protein
VTNSYYGINLFTSSHNTISGNYISDCTQNAVNLAFTSTDNTISRNTIVDSGNGVSIPSQPCKANIILRNNIANNTNNGIILGTNETTTRFNIISGNGRYGVSYDSLSSGGYIYENWIWNNSASSIVQNSVGKRSDFPDNWFYPPNNHDADGDGLTDMQEWSGVTDPVVADTDSDGLDDGIEVNVGTNPVLDDSDGDGYLDGVEFAAASDPLDASSMPGQVPVDTTLILTIVASGLLVVVAIFVHAFITRSRKRKVNTPATASKSDASIPEKRKS